MTTSNEYQLQQEKIEIEKLESDLKFQKKWLEDVEKRNTVYYKLQKELKPLKKLFPEFEYEIKGDFGDLIYIEKPIINNTDNQNLKTTRTIYLNMIHDHELNLSNLLPELYNMIQNPTIYKERLEFLKKFNKTSGTIVAYLSNGEIDYSPPLENNNLIIENYYRLELNRDNICNINFRCHYQFAPKPFTVGKINIANYEFNKDMVVYGVFEGNGEIVNVHQDDITHKIRQLENYFKEWLETFNKTHGVFNNEKQ